MTRPENWEDRALAFMGGDDPATERAKCQAFERILVLLVAADYWAWIRVPGTPLAVVHPIVLTLVSLFAAGAFSGRWRCPALGGLALIQAVRIGAMFPASGNHYYIEFLLLLLAAFLDPRQEAQRRLFLRAVRYMACVVMFYAGVQKIVHGYYFQGQLLAASIQIEAFRPLLRFLMPPGEFARLSALRGAAGEGPYIVSSPLFIFISNATYLFELALVPLLVIRRTRPLAVISGLVFLCFIEIGAREVFFGLLTANLLLLFLARDVNRRLVGVFAAVLFAMLLSRWGILPAAIFY